MIGLITPTHTFTPGAAGVGTLNLSGISGFDVQRLVAVINQTRGVILYAPTVADYTSLASSTLTLSVDTSTHNAADKIFVKYDDGLGDGTDASGVSQLSGATGIRGWLSGIFSKLSSGAASIAKAEDDASANLDVGVPAMAVRKATPANTSGSDGDYEMLQMAAGRLWASALLSDGTNAAAINSAGHLLVGGKVTNPSANFTRPADTTAYALGDLVANSTTAGSVSALSFTATPVSAGSFTVRRVKLHKSGTSVTNSSFRLHLFTAAPGTVTNGDNGAFSVSGVSSYIGSVDVLIDQAFTDGASGVSACDFNIKLASGTTIVGLLEARSAYTPTSAEVLTVTLDVIND